MKTLDKLIIQDSDTWQDLQNQIVNATNHVKALPKNTASCEQTLLNLQVSTHSTLGAIVYETGGLLINHGWVRVIASGHAKFQRNISDWNAQIHANGFLVVADDVLGGVFAMNGGSFGDNLGHIYYFAPDTLAWESLDIAYTDFIGWLLQGDIDKFYQSFYWESWQDEVKTLTTDQVFFCYPPLFTQESKDINQVQKKPISCLENWQLYIIKD